MFKLFKRTAKKEEKAAPAIIKIKFTKKKICETLGLPFDGKDMEFSGLTYGNIAYPGSLAIVQKHRVAPQVEPTRKTREKIVENALSKGAAMLLSDKEIPGHPCLVVPEPIIESLISIVSKEWKPVRPLTIEVTGSYGKTTLVSMLEAALGTKHKVFGHDGDSLNMVVHTIQRVQDWDSSYDVFLQEAAEGAHPGVPGMISRMIEPDICLVTNVGTSHIERMGSQEVIFESCIGIKDGMSKDGVLILNGDDPFLVKAETGVKTVLYGMYNENVDYRAVNVRSTEDGISFDILHEGKTTPVTIPCVGVHNAQNAAGAFAVAKFAGLTDQEAALGLSRFQPTGYRQRMFAAGKYHFYLDCYNASVESMKSALEGLSQMEIPEGGKRIAVLSDIAQTGEYGEEYHRTVGRYAANAKLDVLICHGEFADLVAEEAAADPNLKIYKAKTLEEVEDLLREVADTKDVVLLKASHAMGLHQIPDHLLGTWFDELGNDAETAVDRGLEYKLFPKVGSGYLAKAPKDAAAVDIAASLRDLPITGIGEEAFSEGEVTRVELPESIRNIRRRAFYGAKNLDEIKLPDSVMYIDEEAFANCKKLKKVVLTDKVLHIADSAFEGSPEVRLICPEGSYAEAYALRKGL